MREASDSDRGQASFVLVLILGVALLATAAMFAIPGSDSGGTSVATTDSTDSLEQEVRQSVSSVNHDLVANPGEGESDDDEGEGEAEGNGGPPVANLDWNPGNGPAKEAWENMDPRARNQISTLATSIENTELSAGEVRSVELVPDNRGGGVETVTAIRQSHPDSSLGLMSMEHPNKGADYTLVSGASKFYSEGSVITISGGALAQSSSDAFTIKDTANNWEVSIYQDGPNGNVMIQSDELGGTIDTGMAPAQDTLITIDLSDGSVSGVSQSLPVDKPRTIKIRNGDAAAGTYAILTDGSVSGSDVVRTGFVQADGIVKEVTFNIHHETSTSSVTKRFTVEQDLTGLIDGVAVCSDTTNGCEGEFDRVDPPEPENPISDPPTVSPPSYNGGNGGARCPGENMVWNEWIQECEDWSQTELDNGPAPGVEGQAPKDSSTNPADLVLTCSGQKEDGLFHTDKGAACGWNQDATEETAQKEPDRAGGGYNDIQGPGGDWNVKESGDELYEAIQNGEPITFVNSNGEEMTATPQNCDSDQSGWVDTTTSVNCNYVVEDAATKTYTWEKFHTTWSETEPAPPQTSLETKWVRTGDVKVERKAVDTVEVRNSLAMLPYLDSGFERTGVRTKTVPDPMTRTFAESSPGENWALIEEDVYTTWKSTGQTQTFDTMQTGDKYSFVSADQEMVRPPKYEWSTTETYWTTEQRTGYYYTSETTCEEYAEYVGCVDYKTTTERHSYTYTTSVRKTRTVTKTGRNCPLHPLQCNLIQQPKYDTDWTYEIQKKVSVNEYQKLKEQKFYELTKFEETRIREWRLWMKTETNPWGA